MTRTAEKALRKTVMTKDEWIAQHLRRAPAREEKWVQRLLVLQGKA